MLDIRASDKCQAILILDCVAHWYISADMKAPWQENVSHFQAGGPNLRPHEPCFHFQTIQSCWIPFFFGIDSFGQCNWGFLKKSLQLDRHPSCFTLAFETGSSSPLGANNGGTSCGALHLGFWPEEARFLRVFAMLRPYVSHYFDTFLVLQYFPLEAFRFGSCSVAESCCCQVCFVPLIRLLKLVRRFQKLQLLLHLEAEKWRETDITLKCCHLQEENLR